MVILVIISYMPYWYKDMGTELTLKGLLQPSNLQELNFKKLFGYSHSGLFQRKPRKNIYSNHFTRYD